MFKIFTLFLQKGTKKERGLEAWEAEFSQIGTEDNTGCSGYDIPFVTAPLRG